MKCKILSFLCFHQRRLWLFLEIASVLLEPSFSPRRRWSDHCYRRCFWSQGWASWIPCSCHGCHNQRLHVNWTTFQPCWKTAWCSRGCESPCWCFREHYCWCRWKGYLYHYCYPDSSLWTYLHYRKGCCGPCCPCCSWQEIISGPQLWHYWAARLKFVAVVIEELNPSALTLFIEYKQGIGLFCSVLMIDLLLICSCLLF
uniref:Superoxide dismutase n=1 Tax=Cucurbita maxima TaxID=3661 RepID=M1VQF4_CUCMA|nr:superoxide dismutase [Cucurbita maxima]